MFKILLLNVKHMFKGADEKHSALTEEMRKYNRKARKEKTGKYCYMETHDGKGVRLHSFKKYEEMELKPGKIYKQKFCNGKEVWTIQM